MIPASLKEGDRIRITYKLDGQRIERETVATFLAHNKASYADDLVVSGRPAYGTSNLPMSSIISIEPVDSSVAPYQPRRVPR